MASRSILTVVMLTVCAVGVPMTSAAEPAAPTMNTAYAAGDAANRSVVENLYSAFAAGDGAVIGSLLASDLVWIEAENGPYADRNPYLGPGAVFEGIFRRIGVEFDGFVVTPVTYLVNNDRVAVFGRYSGTNRATGKSLDAQFVHVFTVRDGKIVHFQQYTDTAQWVDVVTPD